MDLLYYKALPDANVQWPQPEPGAKSTFSLVALERTNDPDANNHDGFDYFGAYGASADIGAWANDQPLTSITKEQLPSPVTFYPSPFPEA